MKREIFDRLFAAARDVRERSYAPLSRFRVGAALLAESGAVYAGTNVEEAAFNATIHAEQAAVAQMVAAEGRGRITHLVVVGGNSGDGKPCAPCGHCRQLLVEFADDAMAIVAAGPDGGIRLETTLGALLPHAFRLDIFFN